MKSHLFPHPSAKGFTMLELLVAMSVTVILLGMVTFMTGVSMDGYKGSRDKVLGGRQAKEALEAITQDFEAMVARADGSNNMWLYAAVEPKLSPPLSGAPLALSGPAGKATANSCQLIFFTSAPDRYGGDIGGNTDQGGDVSAVAYRLMYWDPISSQLDPDDNDTGDFPTFTFYRHLVDPNDTFENLLGVDDLEKEYRVQQPSSDDPVNTPYYKLGLEAESVIAENIYEFTITFLVQTGVGISRFTIGDESPEQVPAGPYHAFAIKGNRVYVIDAKPSNFPNIDKNWGAAIEEGQLAGVEINMTVLSERGLVMTQKGGMSRQDIINEYGTHYTDTISVPRF